MESIFSIASTGENIARKEFQPVAMESELFQTQFGEVKKKAKDGHRLAASHLAVVCTKGNGLKPDIEESAKWATLAFVGLTEEEKIELPYLAS